MVQEWFITIVRVYHLHIKRNLPLKNTTTPYKKLILNKVKLKLQRRLPSFTHMSIEISRGVATSDLGRVLTIIACFTKYFFSESFSFL